MRNIFRGEPWPASTIAIISILFTPAVGGIIAGINHRRMGFPERARKDYLLALAAFAIYAVYFSALLLIFSLGKPPPIQIWMLLPTFAIVYHVIASLYFLVPFLFVLVAPSLLITWGLYRRQRRSSASVRRQVTTPSLSTWWQSYVAASILTVVVGLLLSGTVTVLSSLEAFGLLIALVVGI